MHIEQTIYMALFDQNVGPNSRNDAMKFILKIMFSAMALYATNASASPFYIVCYGTNYDYSGYHSQHFDKLRTSNMLYFSKDDAERQKILRHVIGGWAYQEPADTWSCKSFDEDGISAMSAFETSLNRQGYIGLPHDDPRYGRMVWPPKGSK